MRRATAGRGCRVEAGPPSRGPSRRARDTVEQHAGGVVVVALGAADARAGRCVLSPRDDPFDVGVLTAVGQQAGLALERAAMFDQKASVAHELQRALLTTHLPTDDRFTVTTEYRPGVQALEVGGDWYDAFLLDDDVLAVVVGDVVGRGLHAATAMGQLRSAVRAVAGPGVGPAALLARLDRFVDAGGRRLHGHARVRGDRPGHRAGPVRVRGPPAPAAAHGGRRARVPLGGAVDAAGDRPRPDRGRRRPSPRTTCSCSTRTASSSAATARCATACDALAAAGAALLGRARSARRWSRACSRTRGDERDDVCVLVAAWTPDGP